MTDGDQSDTEGSEIAVEEDDMEIENVLRADHFSSVDHSATFSALKILLNCKSLGEVSAETLDDTSTMDFSKRDEGSTRIDSKLMSLNQMWVSSKGSKYLIGKSVMEIKKCSSEVFIERNRLVKMSCVQGRGTSRLVKIKTYHF